MFPFPSRRRLKVIAMASVFPAGGQVLNLVGEIGREIQCLV
jgi:hypothetical protein